MIQYVSAPGETAPAASTPDESPRWFTKLLGLDFLLLLPSLLYLSLNRKANPTIPEALPRLSPEAELVVRSLIAEGKKFEGIKLVSELAKINLKVAEDYLNNVK